MPVVNNNDIIYRDHKDTKERHVADRELANIANENDAHKWCEYRQKD